MKEYFKITSKIFDNFIILKVNVILIFIIKIIIYESNIRYSFFYNQNKLFIITYPLFSNQILLLIIQNLTIKAPSGQEP